MRKFSSMIGILLLVCQFFNASAQDFTPSSEGEIIKHSYFTLAYAEEHEQAAWVYYMLDKNMISGAAERSDNFRADTKVSTESAQLADYKASGYDRGHLCPAASMSINKTAMSESFLMSNMSPQAPSFNRGGWKKLEEQVRKWAAIDTIFVVTGPIFEENKGTIGKNKVTIPGFYFKAIYNPTKEQMIGFIMPNEKLTKPILDYAVKVDSIEKLSKIDFFPQLEDVKEECLEGRFDPSKW